MNPVQPAPPEAAPVPPPVVHAAPSNGFEFPRHYGDDRVLLLVRDPWWIFSYWEVTPGREQTVIGSMGGAHQIDKKVLRVYDVTDSEPPACPAGRERAHGWFDIEVGDAENWYIEVGRPDRDWIVELGFRSRDGRFFALVRSNRVKTPRFGVSDILDEEWMIPDDLFWKLFGLSGGFAEGKSSMSAREFFERHLRSLVSSERSSGALVRTPKPAETKPER